MRFEDSGLQSDDLIVNAFNYAQTYTRSLSEEVLLDCKKLIEANYEDDFDILEEALENEEISQDEYEQEKSILEIMRDEDIKKIMPANAQKELDRVFRDNCVGPALEIQQHSENPSPALIATALLASCVRDPVDCKKIEKNFGENIAGLIAEKLHIKAYPSTHAASTAAASPDTKRLFMAELANDFREATVVKKLGPDETAYLSFEQAKSAVVEAELLWGNDKKLDNRLVDIFNLAAKALFSPLRMELDENGKLGLVRNTHKDPPKTSRKKKPPNTGDDGF